MNHTKIEKLYRDYQPNFSAKEGARYQKRLKRLVLPVKN